MHSNVATVEAYIAEAPPERQAALREIRALCREHLPDYDEVMAYGMPSYTREGEPAFAFASQKGYISLYGMKPAALEPLREQFAGAKFGKGCIRYTRPERIPLDAVAMLLQATAALPD